jgi:hypothetical protein
MMNDDLGILLFPSLVATQIPPYVPNRYYAGPLPLTSELDHELSSLSIATISNLEIFGTEIITYLPQLVCTN